VPGCNLNAITPETEIRPGISGRSPRRFQLDDPELTAKMAQRVGAIFEEDRFAVESVQEVMNRHPGRPFMSLKNRYRRRRRAAHRPALDRPPKPPPSRTPPK